MYRKILGMTTLLVSVFLIMSIGVGMAAETLLVFHYPGANYEARFKAATEYFNQKFPDVKVEYYTGWMSKMDVGIAGGMVPDVISIDPMNIPAAMGKKYLMALDQYIANDRSFNMAEFIPTTVDMVRWQGKVAGLPITVTVKGLMYNKDLFDKAGVRYPDDSWTWDSYITYGKKLTYDSDGNGWLDVFGLDINFGNHSYYPAWIYQSGADFWSDDYMHSLVATPEFQQAIQFISDLANEHGVAPVLQPNAKYLSPDVEGYSYASLFKIGKAAMTWGANELLTFPSPFPEDMRVGLTRFPMGPASRAGLLNGDIVGIYRYAKNPDLAWEYCKAVIITSRERQVAGTEELIPTDQKSLLGKLRLPQFSAMSPDLLSQLVIDGRPITVEHPATRTVYYWFQESLKQKFMLGTKALVGPELQDLARKVDSEIQDAVKAGVTWSW